MGITITDEDLVRGRLAQDTEYFRDLRRRLLEDPSYSLERITDELKIQQGRQIELLGMDFPELCSPGRYFGVHYRQEGNTCVSTALIGAHTDLGIEPIHIDDVPRDRIAEILAAMGKTPQDYIGFNDVVRYAEKTRSLADYWPTESLAEMVAYLRYGGKAIVNHRGHARLVTAIENVFGPAFLYKDSLEPAPRYLTASELSAMVDPLLTTGLIGVERSQMADCLDRYNANRMENVGIYPVLIIL